MLSSVTLRFHTECRNAECFYDERRYAERHYPECRYAEVFILSVVLLSAFTLRFHTECRNAECHYAECHYAECHYAECLYAECLHTECHYNECSSTSRKRPIKPFHSSNGLAYCATLHFYVCKLICGIEPFIEEFSALLGNLEILNPAQFYKTFSAINLSNKRERL
jgi:hypothetical protein